jgi:hypothetical protein
VLAGDFFRGLLYYYKLELVHLIPNSITAISSFIYLCEAYMGILPHFLLWRYFFHAKKTTKSSGIVGSIIFYLRPGRKLEFVNMELLDNNSNCMADWFYIADQRTTLPKRTGHKPVKILEWDLALTSSETEDLKDLLAILADLKEAGLTGCVVVMSFSRRLIQLIKDRMHLAYEY